MTRKDTITNQPISNEVNEEDKEIPQVNAQEVLAMAKDHLVRAMQLLEMLK